MPGLRSLPLVCSLLILVASCASRGSSPGPAPTAAGPQRTVERQAPQRPSATVRKPAGKASPPQTEPIRITADAAEAAPARENPIRLDDASLSGEDTGGDVLRLDDADLVESAAETARILVEMLNNEAVALEALAKASTKSNEYVGGWLVWNEKAAQVSEAYQDHAVIGELAEIPPAPPQDFIDYYLISTSPPKRTSTSWTSYDDYERRQKYRSGIPSNQGNRSSRMEWQDKARKNWDSRSFRYDRPYYRSGIYVRTSPTTPRGGSMAQ